MNCTKHFDLSSSLTGVSKTKTEDRRLGNQLDEMCWNAKTMNSIMSLFCSFTPLKLQNQNALFDAKKIEIDGVVWWCSLRRAKLQNEDPRWNSLFDAKTLKSVGSSFCSFTRLKLQNEDPRQKRFTWR